MHYELSVILPTYNERGNIAEILEKLEGLLQGVPHEFLVVDDNSPDETWALVQELQEAYPHLTLIRRIHRKGLSTAIVEGFLAARGKKLLVTDADLQHDLDKIPELLHRSQEADLVIGTRYEGEGSVGDWDRKRVQISEAGTRLAQWFVPRKVSDPLSGFFLIDREQFHRIAPQLTSNGFKVLLEILIKHPNLSIQEVPCHFHTRQHGESKLSVSIVFDFLDTLLKSKLQLNQTNAIVEKVFVGTAGLFLNVLLFMALRALGLGAVFAGGLSILVTVGANLYLKGRIRKVQLTPSLVKKYLVSRLPAALSVIYLLSVISETEALWGESLLAIIIGSGWNFFGDYFVKDI